MQTLYVYVDGSDNESIETELIDAFSALASDWATLDAVLVNHRLERSSDLAPGDSPDWFIGLNLPLDHLGAAQVKQLVTFAKTLAQTIDRDLVLGIKTPSGISQDLMFLDAGAGEPECLNLLRYTQAATQYP